MPVPAELARRVDNVKGTEASARRPEIGGKKVGGDTAFLPVDLTLKTVSLTTSPDATDRGANTKAFSEGCCAPPPLEGQLPKDGAVVLNLGALGGVSSLRTGDIKAERTNAEDVCDTMFGDTCDNCSGRRCEFNVVEQPNKKAGTIPDCAAIELVPFDATPAHVDLTLKTVSLTTSPDAADTGADTKPFSEGCCAPPPGEGEGGTSLPLSELGGITPDSLTVREGNKGDVAFFTFGLCTLRKDCETLSGCKQM